MFVREHQPAARSGLPNPIQRAMSTLAVGGTLKGDTSAATDMSRPTS
jgi:hypothetical protein